MGVKSAPERREIGMRKGQREKNREGRKGRLHDVSVGEWEA
jgi:hypothetical protein